MARTKIGQVSILPCGEYDSTKKYERLSVVYSEGSSYIAIKENQGESVNNTEYWYKLVSKGDTYEVNEDDLKEIADQITENANSKFNIHVSEKTTEFNDNAINKTTEFDTNVTNKTNTFNGNVETQTNNFNSNSTTKTTEFNNNASVKATAFNNNAVNKTTDFNDNATVKTTEYDNNASAKVSDYNTNTDEKTAEFNENYNNKVELFNANAEELSNEVEELKQDLKALPSQNAEGENLTLTDCADCRFEKFEIKGNSVQDGEPTPENPVEIKNVTSVKGKVTGKNMFNGTMTTYIHNGITIERQENGLYKINGTATQATDIYIEDGMHIPVQANKYYRLSRTVISGSITGKASLNARLIIDGTPTWAWITSTQSVAKSPSQDGYLDRLILYVEQGDTFNNSLIGMQIEEVESENSTATEFEEYKGTDIVFPLSEPLRKIGDYTDYIDFENKKIVKNVKEVVLNSSYYINISGQNEKYSRYIILAPSLKNAGNASNVNCLADKLVATSFADLSNLTKECISSWDNSDNSGYRIDVCILNSRLSEVSVAGFKEFLNNNPITVCCKSSEPQYIDFNAEQLEAWKAIKNLRTSKGTNHIFFEDEISPIVNLTYRKDINTMFEKIEQAIVSLANV